MSKLLEHAESELKRAGLHEPDADYDGMIYNSVMDLMRAFTGKGHSGGSAGQTLAIFNKLANWENLEPLTQDPTEWSDVSDIGGGWGDRKVWQNQRNPSFFSVDGGKTHVHLNDPEFKSTVFGKITSADVRAYIGGLDAAQHRTESPDGETSGSVPGN